MTAITGAEIKAHLEAAFALDRKEAHGILCDCCQTGSAAWQDFLLVETKIMLDAYYPVSETLRDSIAELVAEEVAFEATQALAPIHSMLADRVAAHLAGRISAEDVEAVPA